MTGTLKHLKWPQSTAMLTSPWLQTLRLIVPKASSMALEETSTLHTLLDSDVLRQTARCTFENGAPERSTHLYTTGTIYDSLAQSRKRPTPLPRRLRLGLQPCSPLSKRARALQELAYTQGLFTSAMLNLGGSDTPTQVANALH